MTAEAGNPDILSSLTELARRHQADGGFGIQVGRPSRPDATAWGLLAFKAAGHQPDMQAAARLRLTRFQQTDGRIAISPLLPDAFWPTPLVILAWQGDPAVAVQKQRALDFLLSVSGRHWPRTPARAQIMGHDTALQGWPWVSQTHSWIEPTCLAVIALAFSGFADHARVREAVRMILDRQLTGGGWNYGNTEVFGQTLRPMPEMTGMALSALAGRCDHDDIGGSLTYLRSVVETLDTPLALGWALLGLSAWRQRPDRAENRIAACLAAQSRYGAYDTVSLSLLIVAGLNLRGGLGGIA